MNKMLNDDKHYYGIPLYLKRCFKVNRTGKSKINLMILRNNMKPEDQIVSLELAKKLKELGVKQDSCFHWLKDFSNEFEIVNENEVLHILENYSAFTASELLTFFPSQIEGNLLHRIKTPNDEFFIFYSDYISIKSSIDSNSANTCAKALIYLIENGLVKNEVS